MGVFEDDDDGQYLPGFEPTEEDRLAYEKNKAAEQKEKHDIEHAKVKHSMALPPNALHSALVGKQFKTVFETNDTPVVRGQHKEWEKSTGKTVSPEYLAKETERYKDHRAKIEKGVFGIPEDAPPSKRPMYGFLRHIDNAFPHVIGENYGSAVVDFKKKEDTNVTATVGDSLDKYMQKKRPHEWGSPVSEEDAPVPAKNIDPETVKNTSENYVEAHFHDKPSVDDIEHVHLTGKAVSPKNVNDSITPEDGLRRVNGELDLSEVEKVHAEHEEHAKKLRDAGYTGPITSRVKYTYRPKGLFDTETDPDTGKKTWLIDPEETESTRNF